MVIGYSPGGNACYMCYFHSLVVLDLGSEIQLQMGELFILALGTSLVFYPLIQMTTA